MTKVLKYILGRGAQQDDEGLSGRTLYLRLHWCVVARVGGVGI